MNRLERIPSQSVLGGVAAGIAAYFGVDVALVRVLLVVSFFFVHAPIVLIYIILWIALPQRDAFLPQPGVLTDSAPPASTERSNPVIWGGVLISLGVLFLLDEFFWWFSWGKLWPIVLIVIGAFLIFRERTPRDAA
jgi:phage shock protein C